MFSVLVTLTSLVALAAEPIACRVRALSAAEHREQQAALQRILPAVKEVQELPNGYSLRLSVEALTDAPLWVAREQKCCPFLTLTLRFSPSTEALWVEAVGEPDAKAFVRDTLIAAVNNRQTKPR